MNPAKNQKMGAVGERWKDCYRVGREMAREMPTFKTEEEICRELGLKNHQEAHHLALVALGKLVIRCRRQLKEVAL